MLFQESLFFILQVMIAILLPSLAYKIDLEDSKIFEIATDDEHYDEEMENEMIKPVDLLGLELSLQEESRYKPLHSHVEHFNRRHADQNKIQISDIFTYLQPQKWKESNFEDTDKPFVAGFKEDLDKIDEKNLNSIRNKRNDLWNRLMLRSVNDISTQTDIEDTESSDEEAYDYDKFKKEYESQLENDVRHNKTLNYTETQQTEETAKQVVKEFYEQPKNCTEGSSKIKKIECLIHDYQRTRNDSAIKKLVSKAWLILKVWFLIYICLAIPCWCQKGWCCCCFRCKLCFPRKRISKIKRYYASNPPGILVQEPSKKEHGKPIKYEPTEFEQEAFVQFEAALRDI